MNSSTHRPSKIAGFVLLLALGAGAFFAFRALARAFAHLDVQVGIVTGVAALTVLLSAATIAGALKRARRANGLHPMRGERGALYDRILKVWAVLIAEQHSLADETAKRLNADLAASESGLALIGSPEVIRAYLSLRGATGKKAQQNGDLRGHLKRLMVAMRRDLVADKRDLDDDELLSVLLSAPTLPAQMEQKVDLRAARNSEDLRPRISLAVGP